MTACAHSAKRAFLIMSEANSGSRMMRKAFISAGCHGDVVRGLDPKKLGELVNRNRIVLARSVPNGDAVPNFKEIAEDCAVAGYQVTPILVYRKTDFALAGQMKHYQLTHGQAREYRNLTTTLAYELAAWLGVPLIVVPYEPFVTDETVRRYFFTQFGLVSPVIEFFNANEKYNLEGPPLPY